MVLCHVMLLLLYKLFNRKTVRKLPGRSTSSQFHECWWDSLIIDLFGANLIGMVLGLYTLRFLETRTFDWNRTDGSTRKLARSLVRTSLARGGTIVHCVLTSLTAGKAMDFIWSAVT